MKKFINVYERLCEKTCYGMSFISMICIAFMMVLMTIDVLLSLIINKRIMGAYELTQVALLLVVFSSWAYTQTQHGHIHVVMFINMMPQGLRFFCYGITSLISTVTMGFASYAVWLGIWEKKAAGEATANLLIPFWPLYIIEFLAFVLMTICLLQDTIKAIYAMSNKEAAEEIQKHWA